MGYLVKPIHTVELLPAITVAQAAFARAQALRQDIVTLEERLETRKIVERAKSVIQERLKLDESDAFRWLQKAAMDQRTTMRAVAEVVLASGAGN